MADEAQIRSQLTLRAAGQAGQDVLNYRSEPSFFTFDVGSAFGPSPGAILVKNEGTDVDFSQFTAQGLTPDACVLSNMEASDDANYFVVGRWDPSTRFFYPMIWVWPGESYPLRLAPGVDEEWTGTGTHDWTTTTTLRIISRNATCRARVDAFAG